MDFVRTLGVLLVVVAASVVAGCGPKKCTEGSTQACACMGGQTGVQTCVASGTFGSCNCGQLTEAEARRLVLAQSDFTDGVSCQIRVLPHTTGVFQIGHFDDQTKGCYRQLLAAGYVGEGECIDDFCGNRVVVPTEKSRVDNGRLKFDCGTVSLVGVSGITTTGNTATLRYDRDVTHDPAVMSALTSCRIDVAQAGRATRERSARRDDAGNWSLVNAP